MKRIIAALVAVLALAGCASTASHDASKPNTVAASSPAPSPSCGQDGYMCSSVPPSQHQASHAAGASALWRRSFKAGIALGKSTAAPNQTDAQIHSNCKKHLPRGDNKSAWMGGCFAGTISGLVAIDQSNGG